MVRWLMLQSDEVSGVWLLLNFRHHQLLEGRWDGRQRHSIRGCVDLVMLEHGNGKHHLHHDISSSQFTFLPKDFLLCCQYHWAWGLDFVNIKIWVLTSKRVVDLFT
uniref:Uncharacterized protein n=1 Tax=Aegilops tauschii subsp. strangulata TaxID=200361 RepID=A0A453KGG8_AEGTS